MAGCGSDDDNTGGGGSSGRAGSAGKAGSGDAGSGEDAGAGGTTSSTLYERLGGHDGITAAVTAIVGEELKDDDIATFFAPNLSPGHMPQAGDIVACFTNLVGKAAGGDEEYPFETDSGFTCRGMAEAHAELHIGSGTFDDFIVIAAKELKALGVADDDIAVLGSVLVGTKDVIVDPDAPERGPCVSAACVVGGEAGAGGAGEGGAAGAP